MTLRGGGERVSVTMTLIFFKISSLDVPPKLLHVTKPNIKKGGAGTDDRYKWLCFEDLVWLKPSAITINSSSLS